MELANLGSGELINIFDKLSIADVATTVVALFTDRYIPDLILRYIRLRLANACAGMRRKINARQLPIGILFDHLMPRLMNVYFQNGGGNRIPARYITITDEEMFANIPAERRYNHPLRRYELDTTHDEIYDYVSPKVTDDDEIEFLQFLYTRVRDGTMHMGDLLVCTNNLILDFFDYLLDM